MQGKKAKGAGQGCAQQHRWDPDGERGRQHSSAKNQLRNSFAESELPLSFREREVNLDVG